jgi:integrase
MSTTDNTAALVPLAGSTLPDELVTRAADLVAKAEHHTRNARAENTRRTYRSAWRTFETWCALFRVSPLPASHATVKAYLTDRAETVSRASLDHALAAIAAEHKANGLHFDRKHPDFADFWTGLSRHKAAPAKQADPLLVGDLRTLLRFLGHDLRAIRDKAILALGFSAALRRSELAGLDLGPGGDGDGWIDVRADGVLITLRRSKASQDEAETIAVPRSGTETCAVALVEAWIAEAQIAPGSPVFRPIWKGGRLRDGRLTAESVSDIVRARILEDGLATGLSRAEAERRAARFSGHSMRAGLATSAAQAGANEFEIRSQTRHKSVEMVGRYVRLATRFDKNVLRKVGL